MKQFKINAPKFQPGQTVFAYFKNGLQAAIVTYIHIHVSKDGQIVSYGLNDNYRDIYYEEDLIHNYEAAKIRLAENSTQLVLHLE